MMERFPECLYFTSDNCHHNLISLLYNSYDLSNILKTVKWTICDYNILSHRQKDISDEFLEKILNDIHYDHRYVQLFMKHGKLFNKFFNQITSNDEYLKYIDSVKLLNEFKNKNVELPPSLFQIYLTKNNFKCFQWVHKNIKFDNTKLIYTVYIPNEEEFNYDWSNMVDNLTDMLVYLYNNKSELNVEILYDF